jgi:hydroxymethylpyrimidine pyrophosphatase-like HAD family hydrolase
MTEQIMKLSVDCSTQQSEYVPMSSEELAQREADLQNIQELSAAIEAEAIAKAAAKASAIQKIMQNTGLTQEEAEALYS